MQEMIGSQVACMKGFFSSVPLLPEQSALHAFSSVHYLSVREIVLVRSRQAGPQDQNTDWFDFGSKIPKSVVCGLEVVQ